MNTEQNRERVDVRESENKRVKSWLIAVVPRSLKMAKWGKGERGCIKK